MHLKLSTIKPAPIPYHLILVCKGVNKRSRFITPSINRSIRASRPLLPAQPLSQNLMCTFDRCCLIPRILSRVLKPLGLSENGMGKPKSNWLIIIPSRLMAIGVKMAIACYSPLLLRICGQLCQPRIQPALASGKVAFLGQLATNLQKGQNQINRLEHGRADTCSRLLPNWQKTAAAGQRSDWYDPRKLEEPQQNCTSLSKYLKLCKLETIRSLQAFERTDQPGPPWKSQELPDPSARIPGGIQSWQGHSYPTWSQSQPMLPAPHACESHGGPVTTVGRLHCWARAVAKNAYVKLFLVGERSTVPQCFYIKINIKKPGISLEIKIPYKQPRAMSQQATAPSFLFHPVPTRSVLISASESIMEAWVKRSKNCHLLHADAKFPTKPISSQRWAQKKYRWLATQGV